MQFTQRFHFSLSYFHVMAKETSCFFKQIKLQHHLILNLTIRDQSIDIIVQTILNFLTENVFWIGVMDSSIEEVSNCVKRLMKLIIPPFINDLKHILIFFLLHLETHCNSLSTFVHSSIYVPHSRFLFSIYHHKNLYQWTSQLECIANVPLEAFLKNVLLQFLYPFFPWSFGLVPIIKCDHFLQV